MLWLRKCKIGEGNFYFSSHILQDKREIGSERNSDVFLGKLSEGTSTNYVTEKRGGGLLLTMFFMYRMSSI